MIKVCEREGGSEGDRDGDGRLLTTVLFFLLSVTGGLSTRHAFFCSGDHHVYFLLLLLPL